MNKNKQLLLAIYQLAQIQQLTLWREVLATLSPATCPSTQLSKGESRQGKQPGHGHICSC